MFSRIEVELFYAVALSVFSVACVGTRNLIAPRLLTMSQLAILTNAMYFGAGPLFSYFIGEGSLSDVADDTLFNSYLLLALYAVGLTVLPKIIQWFKPGFKNIAIWDILSLSDKISWKFVAGCCTLLFMWRLYVGSAYGILFYGTGTGERISRLPYLVVIFQSIFEMIGTGCLLWGAATLWDSKNRTHFIASLLINFYNCVWAILQGRRPIMVAFFIFFFCYNASRGVVKLKQVVLGTTAFAFIFVLIFPYFIKMRISHDESSGDDDGVVHVYNTVLGSAHVSNEQARIFFQENMGSRPLIIRFICKIVESQKTQPPMYGAALQSTLIWAIPSFFYSQKSMGLQTEQYIQYVYYHPLIDTSITWPALGCADFGIPGGFIIGIFLGCVLLAIEKISIFISKYNAFLAVGFLGMSMVILGSVEEDPSALICIIRNVFVIFALALPLTWLGLNRLFASPEIRSPGFK